MTTIEKEFVKQLNNVLQTDISEEQRGALLSLYLWGTKVLSLSGEIKSWATRAINSYTFKEDFLRGGNVFCTEADALCRIERIGMTPPKFIHKRHLPAQEIFIRKFKEEMKKEINKLAPFGSIAGDGLIQHLKMDAFTKARQKDIEYYKQRKKNLRSLYDEGLISMNVCATELEHVNKILEKYEC